MPPNLVRTFRYPEFGANHGVVSPDGKTFAAGVIARADQNLPPVYGAVLWELATGKQVRVLERAAGVGAQGPEWALAFSPDGSRLASGNAEGTVTLWNVIGGQVDRTLSVSKDHVIEHLAFSPDGQTLAAATNGGPVQLWDVRTGTRKHTLTGMQFLAALAFSPDGRRLAAGCGLTVGGDLKRLKQIPVGELKVGEFGASREVGELRVWDTASGQVLWSKSGGRKQFVASIAYSVDGKHVFSGGEQFVASDAESGRTLWTQKVRPLQKREGLPDGHVLSVACAPGGQQLATTSIRLVREQRSVWVMEDLELWEPSTGRRLESRASERDQKARNVAYSTDGKLFWCSDGQGEATVRVWFPRGK